MFKKFVKFGPSTFGNSITIDIYSIIAIEDTTVGSGRPTVAIYTDGDKTFYILGEEKIILDTIKKELIEDDKSNL